MLLREGVSNSYVWRTVVAKRELVSLGKIESKVKMTRLKTNSFNQLRTVVKILNKILAN